VNLEKAKEAKKNICSFQDRHQNVGFSGLDTTKRLPSRAGFLE
jgi:hypothetical protein